MVQLAYSFCFRIMLFEFVSSVLIRFEPRQSSYIFLIFIAVAAVEVIQLILHQKIIHISFSLFVGVLLDENIRLLVVGLLLLLLCLLLLGVLLFLDDL